MNWQQGSNRLLMIPEPGACGPLIEAHDRWDADPVSSSVMQTREAGGTEWPSSAEDRLQAFVQSPAATASDFSRNFVDIIKSDKLRDLLSHNLRAAEKEMSAEQFKREMLEWKELAERSTEKEERKG